MKKDKGKEVQSHQRDRIRTIPISLTGLNPLMTFVPLINDFYATLIYKILWPR